MQQENSNNVMVAINNSVWVTLKEEEWKYFISQFDTECRIWNGQLMIPMKEYLLKYSVSIESMEAQNDGSYIIRARNISRENIEFLEVLLARNLSNISADVIVEDDEVGYEPLEKRVVVLEFEHL